MCGMLVHEPIAKVRLTLGFVFTPENRLGCLKDNKLISKVKITNLLHQTSRVNKRQL